MDILLYRENRKKRLLLVEDENLLAKIYFNELSRVGYKVLLSKTGKSALNKFLENHIDLVILDLMLPDLSGVELLKRIRSDKKPLKVIVLTNLLNDMIQKECETLGVDLYLAKSDYTPDQIVERITDLLSV